VFSDPPALLRVPVDHYKWFLVQCNELSLRRVLTWDENCVLWVPPRALYYRLQSLKPQKPPITGTSRLEPLGSALNIQAM
jgi:hypothetical protein